MKNFINKGLAALKNNLNPETEAVLEKLELSKKEYSLIQFLLENPIQETEADIKENKTSGIVAKINSTKANIFNSLSENISNGVSASKDKINKIADVTKEFAQDSTQIITSNSSIMYNNISGIEKKKLLNKILQSVDIDVLINLLKDLKNKSTDNPPQALALTGLITVLSYFEKNKDNPQALEDFQEHKEVNKILNQIPLKDILNYANTISIFLPPQFRIPFLIIINILKMFV